MKMVTVFCSAGRYYENVLRPGGEQFVYVIRFEQHWIPF
jgi:hypothetical protein